VLPIEPVDRAEAAEIRERLRRDGRMWEDVDLDRSRFLVCRDAGERVGWVAVEIDGRAAILRSLFTDPAFRRRGIGRALVAAAEREAARQGVTLMVLFSTEAGGYFRSLGYEEVPVHEAMAVVWNTPQALWYRARPQLLAVEVTYRKALDAGVCADRPARPSPARGRPEPGVPIERLETPRLRLRPLAPGDLAALTRIWTDPEVSRLLLSRPRDRSEVEARLRGMLAHARLWGMWGIELRATDELVGRCGFYPYSGEGARGGGPEPELAFLLARAQWGRGLATEAARAALAALLWTHPQARAVALVRPEHAACRRVLEKVGLAEERRVVVAGVEVVRYVVRTPPAIGG
jgi:ribosomal-protein-alanine N-acetyltransferase